MRERLDRSVPPQVKRIFDVNFGKADILKFPNGIDVYLCHDGTEQDVVRIDLMMKGGKWAQKSILQALFTSRMLREGTLYHTSDEIAETFDYYGAWTEMSTSMLHSYVSMYSLSKFFKPTLELLYEIVTAPLFDAGELSTVVAINKQNCMLNNAKTDYLAQKGLLQMMYGTAHPVGAYAELEDYDSVSVELLRDFYDRYYNSDNTVIFLSGHLTDEIVATVKEIFGARRYGACLEPYPERKYEIRTMPETFCKCHVGHALQTSIRFGLFIPDRTHPDYQNLRVLITVFGGYFGSRIMRNIREEKGYTYGISAGTAFYPDSGLMIVSTEANSDCYQQVIEEVRKEMDILRNEPISEQELDNVRNYMMGDFMRTFEGSFSVADSQMFLMATGLTEDFYRESIRTLRNVTSEELIGLARKYFNPDDLYVSVAGNI